MQKQKGFTLVELAVVMIVIGLLVGGILKGQAMIENARIGATIKQVNEISAAVDTFQEKYAQRPGDMLNATQRITNCAAPACLDGDGNNLIGSDGVTENHSWVSNVVDSAFGMETIQFWRHLAAADIMSGIDVEADLESPNYGRTHLASPFGGGYEMYFDRQMTVGAGDQTTAMHVLRLNGLITGGANGIVNTIIAQAIDTKIDDGDPNSGFVFADYGSNITICKNAGPGGGRSSIYDVANEQNSCVLFFRMFNR